MVEKSEVIKDLHQYTIARFALLTFGIILYYSHNFWVINAVPYFSFLFGSISFYMLSPAIPILLAVGYLLALYLEKYNLNTNLLIILSIFDAFASPVGIAFALLIIFLILYYCKPQFSNRQMIAILLPFIFFFPVNYYFITPSEQTYETPSVMTLGNYTSQEFIIQLNNYPAPQAVQTQSVVVQAIQTLGGTVEDTTAMPINSILTKINPNKLTQLVNTGYVKAIYPNEKVVKAFNVTYTLNDIHSLLNIPYIPSNGSGIVIAVVDTGINEQLPIFKRGNQSVIIDSYHLHGEYVAPHGTEVASCIASQDSRYPGVARGVDLLNVEVFQPGGLSTYWDILKGWDWVANWKMSHNMYVICTNSFGAPDSPSASVLKTALDRMVTAYDIPMIVASGNSVTNRIVMTPGNAKYAFTIGAVDKANTLAYFSCYGPEVDVVSYGVSIHTFDSSGTVVTVDGTSFSTPIVAGCFALVAEKEKLSTLSMYSLFRTTAKDLGSSGFDIKYGYGLVNPVDAYSTATNERISTNNVEQATVLSLIPSLFGFVAVGGIRWKRKLL